jgi:2-C-methyl-D-erythritol 4-phosphate cytidylyltransferase
MRVGAVIVSAGEGRRVGAIDKAVINLKGKPLFYYSVDAFRKIKEVEQIILVLREKNFPLAKKIIKDKRVVLVKGGRERKDSVYNGLRRLGEEIDYVLIHDGARPFVTKRIINRILKTLKEYAAVICGVKVRDTLKVVSGRRFVRKTLEKH